MFNKFYLKLKKKILLHKVYKCDVGCLKIIYKLNKELTRRYYKNINYKDNKSIDRELEIINNIRENINKFDKEILQAEEERIKNLYK